MWGPHILVWTSHVCEDLCVWRYVPKLFVKLISLQNHIQLENDRKREPKPDRKNMKYIDVINMKEGKKKKKRAEKAN